MSDHKPKSAPLAYQNEPFLNSPDGRILRILSEYVEPLARFRREQIQDTVVFFGSARFKNRSTAESALSGLKNGDDVGTEENRLKRAQAAVNMARYYEDSRRMAYLLTEWSIRIPAKRRRFVVTTGGGPGIMEAANLGAHEAGGKSIGLNINLPFEQYPNPYVIFPGGFGTLDELFEILTLAQTDKLAKKILVVIYGREYWDKILNLQHMADAGTISQADLDLFKIVDSPEEGFEYLRDGLTKHHLGPQPKQVGERVPEIAKTRP
jgi:predicted Rossmann-fold nucleotide-binding protein